MIKKVKKKISEICLFENLTEFNIENTSIDLHNDYVCIQIEYMKEEIKFIFVRNSLNEDKNLLEIVFKRIEFRKCQFEFNKLNSQLTVDNFYRGRFTDDDKLFDLTNDGKGDVFIEFYEGLSYEFFAYEMILRIK